MISSRRGSVFFLFFCFYLRMWWHRPTNWKILLRTGRFLIFSSRLAHVDKHITTQYYRYDWRILWSKAAADSFIMYLVEKKKTDTQCFVVFLNFFLTFFCLVEIFSGTSPILHFLKRLSRIRVVKLKKKPATTKNWTIASV